MPKSRQTLLFLLMTLAATVASAQLAFPGSSAAPSANLLTDASATPGKQLLLDLEARFAADVAAGGGKAFAEWFADDGVTLGNGQPAQRGKAAIAGTSAWNPSEYQLSWTPTEAVMGPSGDLGYTWGHFTGRSMNASGQTLTTTGRYLTIWRKQADGTWKVVLDAGANDAADSNECCSVKP